MDKFNSVSKDVTFEDFKSNTCHTLKSMGDIRFLVEVLSNHEIDNLYRCKEYLKCIYLLAMVDYLSRKNEIPLVQDYNEYRKMKSEYIVYPSSVIAESSVMKSDLPKKLAYENSIDEFKRVNIVESEIYNVA